MVADHACYQGNWICDETLVRLLTKQSPSLNDGIGLNLMVFNRALSSYSVECGSGLKEKVLFRKRFRMRCPYDDPTSTTRRPVFFYYWHENGNPPANPTCSAECNNQFVSEPNVEPLAGVADVAASILEEVSASSTPQRVTRNNDANTVTPGKGDTRPSVDWWESLTAATTFGFKYGDDIKTLLQKRVDLLDAVAQSHDGYRQFVSNIDVEPLSEKQRHRIECQRWYLRVAYSIALRTLGKDNTTKWSTTCCQKAVEQMAEVGYTTTKSRKQVMNWNKVFRKQRQFPHPNPLSMFAVTLVLQQ